MDCNEEKKRKHVYIWKVENFSKCCKKRGEEIISPTFKAKCFEETSWHLSFYPQGDKPSVEGYVSCYLRRKKDDTVPFGIECDYIIEIINKNGQTVAFLEGTSKFKRGTGWGRYNFMKVNELVKTALYNDTLTIRCTLCGNMPEKNFSSQNTSSTKFKISKHCLEWVIKNVNSVTHQEVIKLPCSGTSQVEITIQIPEDDVKICISTDENFSGSRFISCNFALLDVEGKERDSKQATHLFENAETWKFPNFLKKSQLNTETYLKDGCFSLQCDIAVSDGSIVEDIEEKGDHLLADKFTDLDKDTIVILNEDIKRMYTDKIHADIKLIADKQVFPAHKSVLCARSPVFLAMFDTDMAESQKGEVNIPDLDAKTVDLFLEYLYTGTANELDYDKAMKLVMAADKYQVLSLKNKCAKWLKSTLSDSNVCEILVTADLIQHYTLKAACLDYIKKQPDKIFNSEEWKHCVKNNFELATETLCEVSRLWGDQTKEQCGK